MKKWKISYYVGIIVVILALIGIAIYLIIAQISKSSMNDLREEALIDKEVGTTNETIPYPAVTYETIVVDEVTGEEVTKIVDPGLECPVDFFVLWNTNSDIYAWLRIPGTNIDYPVLQHTGNIDENNYYLRKDLEGNYSTAGNLFSQYSYNSNFKEDKLTVIYGHNMRDESMFGTIDFYIDNEDYVLDHQYIYMYTPYNSYLYRVVGTIVKANGNVMYKYSGLVDGQGDFTDFVRDFNDGTFGSGWIEDGFVASEEDNFLILSTCTPLADARILIVAVREEAT